MSDYEGNGSNYSCVKRLRSVCWIFFIFFLERLWRITASVFYWPIQAVNFAGSNALRFQFYIYWCFARRLPPFISQYQLGGKDCEISRLREDKQAYKCRIDQMNLDILHYKAQLDILKQNLDEEVITKEKLEAEKQDALTRLSEMVSVKLRDNNPNIVDLNDQCRPTKLAEMFSELYDNEWTSVYSTLEKQFGERMSIEFLLAVMMDVYVFCEKEAETSWSFLLEWFLDMDMPGAQQTSKWLKDSRKAKIRNQVENVEKNLNQELVLKYQRSKLSEAISHNEMHEYLRKCVEISLLMVTTDPPVMPTCPGWVPMWREQQETGKSLPTTEGDTIQGKEEGGDDNEATNMDTVNTVEEWELNSFDKSLYKEYTVRGPLLDFVVWPALLLHKNGPLLSKGIAQGKKKKIIEGNQET